MTRHSNSTEIEAIVAQAYAAIASPEGVIELLGPISRFASAGAEGASALEVHLENAADIIDRVYPLTPDDLADLTVRQPGEYDSDLTIDAQRRILHVADGLFSDSGFARGRFLPAWALSQPGDAGADGKALPTGDSPGLVQIADGQDDPHGSWFMVRRRHRDAGVHFDFFALRMQWNDEHGLSFQEALRLSDVETMLLRHLVRGGSLRSFAEARQRSIGTVRNQMKVLQRKLAVRSKEEVLLLYAGFVGTLEESSKRQNSAAHVCAHELATPTGPIAWEEMGDPAGKPVIFFHPLEGALLPKTANAVFERAGLRIIAPWRPFYGDTRGHGFGLSGLPHFAQNVRALLDQLQLDRVTGFATQAGAPYMFACAKASPARFERIVGAGAFLPVSGEEEMAMIPLSHRLSIAAVRSAPTFARMYQRGMRASIGKGSFHRFIDNFYAGHERELAAVRSPELQSAFLRSATYALTGTIDGLIDTMQTWASDWSDLLVDRNVALTLIYGSHDANMPPKLVAAASKRLSLPDAIEIEDAGSFLLVDAPDRLADVLLRKADGNARTCD